MKQHKLKWTTIVYVGAALAAPALSSAQISPPPGPIQNLRPTIITAGGGLPIVISQPGSYRLGGDVTAVAATNGIEITASNVTLDLDGHVLDGADIGLDGIEVQGYQNNISVFNGNVTRWTTHGIDAFNTSVTQFRDLRIVYCNGDGLRTGAGGSVTACVVGGGGDLGNGGTGILASGCTVSHCQASGNSGAGIDAKHSTITACTVFGNEAGGIVVDESSVTDCLAWANFEVGNGIAAIQALNFCLIRGNTVVSTVLATDGIRATGSGNRIEGNHVYLQTDMTGISVTGSSNRVDGNNVEIGWGPANGIVVAAGNNLIIRNTVTGGGTHYTLGAGNAWGPVHNVSGVGDIQAAVPATQHPWTNFSY